MAFISARDADKILRKNGFVLASNNGGHVKYKHPDGRVCVMRDPARARGNDGVNCARPLSQVGIRV